MSTFTWTCIYEKATFRRKWRLQKKNAIVEPRGEGGGEGPAGSPSHNALRMNYIINCRLSRDILFVSGVHGVRLRVTVDYFFNVCR